MTTDLRKTERRKKKPGSFLFEYIGAINRETPPVPSCLFFVFFFVMTGGGLGEIGSAPVVFNTSHIFAIRNLKPTNEKKWETFLGKSE